MRLALTALFLFFTAIGFGQKSELGFGLGTLNYSGDLSRGFQFKNLQPAGTAFFRSNISQVVSFRTSVTAGKLAASEQPIDALGSVRGKTFNVFLFEASTVMEYHFMNWRDLKRFNRFSPYWFGGIGLFGFTGPAKREGNYSTIQPVVPFGIGVKYIYNPSWYLALEFGARKTFFDQLDGVSGGNIRNKNFQFGNPADNDAYYFVGITLTRTFYSIPCPKNPY